MPITEALDRTEKASEATLRKIRVFVAVLCALYVLTGTLLGSGHWAWAAVALVAALVSPDVAVTAVGSGR